MSAADPNFIAFAQIHLQADPLGAFCVADAFATYAAFTRRRDAVMLSRANFGALLTAMARSVGGGREGDRISALSLMAPVAAPACEAVRTAPSVPPMPSAQRLRVPILPPLRRAHVSQDEALPVLRQGGDAVDRFLATRLAERPGYVVAVETLRKLVRSEGLRFAEVVERAKARCHQVRKNAWGPDFLTDAQLIDAREAAE
ncbi:hypothetical protein GTW51_14905 [Aurantimonas aggregata]|uniref:Uncharacterized protein n=1 Tax=Aurantimonas aggregata TaxID=2047720 RepID=A0A6L9MK37_9HYPH|nr:hypothetical protein [Aurantimonas aggregata]NDV87992.1 hypothetical protein [Aurantimonas aggregata]